MNGYTATVVIGGSGGFVCPLASVTVERELLTIKAPVALRWLIWNRRISAADTTAVYFSRTGVRLEKRNGMAYELRGPDADAIMGALTSSGFPMTAGPPS